MTRSTKGAGVLALALIACAPQAPPWRGATPAQWPILRRALQRVRADRPARPWTAGVTATLRAAQGSELRARGAMAVAPGQAVRVILVGGPGGTALDVWVTADRWRIAVPPAGLVRRGTTAPDDLPVAFLRGWFFGALDGRVFAASIDQGDDVWLLREGGAVLEVRATSAPDRTRLRVARRASGRTERVDERRAGAGPRPGDRVDYDDGRGLGVTLEIETVAAGAPPREAFDDPDRGGS